MRVPVICAWCEAERKREGLEPKLLRYIEMEPIQGMTPEKHVSHGMCKECLKTFPWAAPREGA